MALKREDLIKSFCLIGLIIFILYFFQCSTRSVVYKNDGNLNVENLNNYVKNEEDVLNEESNINSDQVQVNTEEESSISNISNNSVEQYNNSSTAASFPSDQLKPEDLLPKDNDSTLWAQVNPNGKGNLTEKNYLSSGHFIGVNTVGQSLRNANLQLRSEPPNPRQAVSPWLQSTIEPDNNRKHFEIGQC